MIKFPDPNDRPELRKRIADNLGDLAEKVIKREYPFDKIPLYERLYREGLIKYYKNYNNIPEDFRNALLDYYINLARHFITEGLLGTAYMASFHQRYPMYKQDKRYFEWNRETSPLIVPGKKAKFRENEIIKEVFKQRGFTYYDKRISPNLLSFGVDLDKDRKIMLHAHKDTYLSALDFLIGMEDPEFDFSVGLFLGRHLLKSLYLTPEEAVNNLNKMMDFTEILLPHFKEAVLKAFST